MQRENISAAEARRILGKDDLAPKMELAGFGVDTQDPMAYDFVLILGLVRGNR